MKCIVGLLLAACTASGQTGTSSVQGSVLDAKTGKPIASAIVMANRAGAPPFTKYTRSGGDGAFRIQGLTAGSFSICVQVAGDQHLDPCDWNPNPSTITLASGQNVAGIALRLTSASELIIEVQDAQNALRQRTRDGRRPELSVGVWGPRGLYYPARRAASAGADQNPTGGMTIYGYRLAVPRDTALILAIASRDLRLGDATGAALPANAQRESFQHTTGDGNPRRFAFTVLGLLP